MTKTEILNQLKNGQISTDEAMKLLETASPDVEVVDEVAASPVAKKAKSGKKKFIHIRVNSPEKGEKVNIRLPLGLVDMGLKMGAKFDDSGALKNIDPEEIRALLEDETLDKIVDIQGENGETVEITIEEN